MRHLLGTRLVVWACLLLVFAVASGAQATPVSQGGSLNLGSCPFYTSGSPGSIGMNVSVAGTSGINDNTGARVWVIRANGGQLVWNGTPLTSDASRPVGADYLAEGYFGAGGTLTITGTVYNKLNQIVYNGPDPLLVATVGTVHILEDQPGTSTLATIGGVAVTPTGGWLYTNSTLQWRGTYSMSFTMDSVRTMTGGALDNFGSSLKQSNAFMMQFFQLPEPASLLLLLVGFGLVASGRSCARSR